MSEDAKNVFAERLRYVRDELRGLTQAQLSEKTGLPTTSISHFENPTGTRKPSFDNLRLLAKALDVTTDYLLGLSDELQGSVITTQLYRDMQKLTDQDMQFAEMMIKNMAEKNSKKE